MTEQRDETDGPPAEAVHSPVGKGATPAISRRSLLKGATIAAPSILTLSSASAVAAYSSVRVYTHYDGAHPDGNFYCLDAAKTDHYYPGVPPNDPKVEFQNPSLIDVYKIEPQDYRIDKDNNAAAKTEQDMCLEGGDYYYHQAPGGWHGVHVRQGILLSGSAMTSLGVTAMPVETL